jgi:hypothetical protein
VTFAASSAARTCSGSSSVASAISSSDGSRPSSARSRCSARAIFRCLALDRLPDPDRRVRGELVAAPPVELLGSADQPEHALLDQVLERQSEVLVLACIRDDEPQVGVHEQLLRVEIATLDALGELDLFILRQERIAIRAGEEEREPIVALARTCDRARPRPLELLLRLLGLVPGVFQKR